MSFDLQEMLSNPAALAATVAGITAWLKARIGSKENTTVLISFVVSTILIIAALLSNIYPEIIQIIVLIIIGAVGAGGSIDILKGVLSKSEDDE